MTPARVALFVKGRKYSRSPFSLAKKPRNFILLREIRKMIDRSSRSQEQVLRSSLRSLEQKVLTIDDVDRILKLPHMLHLMDDAVDMSSLIGKRAE
jgi:hypothetical protein